MSTLKTNAIRNANASSDGVTLNSDGTIAIPSDKHIVLPSGTTAQRAGSPPSYSLRYNTTLGELEFWDGTNWNTINQTKAWEVDNTATHWWKSEGIASNSSWVPVGNCTGEPCCFKIGKLRSKTDGGKPVSLDKLLIR